MARRKGIVEESSKFIDNIGRDIRLSFSDDKAKGGGTSVADAVDKGKNSCGAATVVNEEEELSIMNSMGNVVAGGDDDNSDVERMADAASDAICMEGTKPQKQSITKPLIFL